MRQKLWVAVVGLIALMFSSSGGASMMQAGNADRALIEARLRHYDELVRAFNAKELAQMFTPDGEVQHQGQAATVGREAIEKLFSGFSGYTMLENSTTPTSTVVQAQTAVQTGSYHQKLKTPDGAVVEVSGSFTADWVKVESGEWYIKRMHTRS